MASPMIIIFMILYGTLATRTYIWPPKANTIGSSLAKGVGNWWHGSIHRLIQYVLNHIVSIHTSCSSSNISCKDCDKLIDINALLFQNNLWYVFQSSSWFCILQYCRDRSMVGHFRLQMTLEVVFRMIVSLNYIILSKTIFVLVMYVVNPKYQDIINMDCYNYCWSQRVPRNPFPWIPLSTSCL